MTRQSDLAVQESVEFVSLDKAAERLRVSQDTVEGYLKAGTLRGFRMGTEWRITLDDLREFMQSQPKEELRLFPVTRGMKRGKHNRPTLQRD